MGDSVKLRVWLGGLAIAGMVAGHHVGYLLATSGADHPQVLERTGHSHWGSICAIALGLLIANLYHVALRRLRSSVAGCWDGRRIFRYSASRLLVLQPVAFVVLELLERMIAGQPIAHLLLEPAVMVGLACQIVFAVAGAFLLVLFLRAVAAVARRLTPRTNSSDRVRPLDNHRTAFPQVVALSRWAPRAPPSVLLNF